MTNGQLFWRVYLLLGISIFFALISQAQNRAAYISQERTDTPFAAGIRINDGVLIPWGTDFKELTKYGTPTISRKSGQKVTSAIWDSVEIIPGIKVKLYTNDVNAGYRISDTAGNFVQTNKVIYFFAAFDSDKWTNLYNTLIDVLGNPKKTRPKRFRNYSWTIAKTSISISKKRNKESYLTIVRHGM